MYLRFPGPFVIFALGHVVDSDSRNHVGADHSHPQEFGAFGALVLGQFFRNVGQPDALDDSAEEVDSAGWVDDRSVGDKLSTGASSNARSTLASEALLDFAVAVATITVSLVSVVAVHFESLSVTAGFGAEAGFLAVEVQFFKLEARDAGVADLLRLAGGAVG